MKESPFIFPLLLSDGTRVGAHAQSPPDGFEDWDSSIAMDVASDELAAKGWEVIDAILPLDTFTGLNWQGDEVRWDWGDACPGVLFVRPRREYP